MENIENNENSKNNFFIYENNLDKKSKSKYKNSPIINNLFYNVSKNINKM